MIIDAILGAFLGALEGLFSIMPAWDPDLDALETNAEKIGEAASLLNGYIPLGTIMIVLGILVTARVALMAFQLIQWVWDRLPLT